MRPLQRTASAFLLVLLCARAAFAADGDVVLKRASGDTDLAPAVFPHWIHRIRYTCYACHPAPFEMRAGGNRVTMDDIMAGKSCGACHNGKTAWPVTFETCNRCHRAP